MTRMVFAALSLAAGFSQGRPGTGTASILLTDRGTTLNFVITGASAMSAEFISSVSGSSTLTLLPCRNEGEEECTETMLVTDLEWGRMAVTASDTTRQWLRGTPDGIELRSDSIDSIRFDLIPGLLEPGTAWSSVRGGYLEYSTVISCDRTVRVPAGTFSGCVMISSVRESSGATRSAVEYLAPGVGRVMLVEELASPENWSLILIHRLGSIDRDAGLKPRSDPLRLRATR